MKIFIEVERDGRNYRDKFQMSINMDKGDLGMYPEGMQARIICDKFLRPEIENILYSHLPPLKPPKD